MPSSFDGAVEAAEWAGVRQSAVMQRPRLSADDSSIKLVCRCNHGTIRCCARERSRTADADWTGLGALREWKLLRSDYARE